MRNESNKKKKRDPDIVLIQKLLLDLVAVGLVFREIYHIFWGHPGKLCYIILIAGIIFLLTSVSNYLFMAKEKKKEKFYEKYVKNKPSQNQRKKKDVMIEQEETNNEK